MYVPRELEEKVFDWMEEREIIAIIGPRQSGKTTLLERIKERSLSEGMYDEKHIVYITFEDEMERLEFEEDPDSNIKGHLIDEGPYLFLLDEAQYVKYAGRALKLLFDKYHDRIKFVITGSSSPDLRDMGGALVGRVIFFELYPFSFGEFLLAKDERIFEYYRKNRVDPKAPFSVNGIRETYLKELNGYLKEYMTFGGFPRIALMKDIEKKKVLLKHLISLYIEKDILKIHGKKFRNDALKVLQHLAYNSGSLVKTETISSDLGIEVNKVNETLDILEISFIIKRIRPFFMNMTTELRKTPKVYFMDNGIRNVLQDDFTFSREKGFLLENHVFSELNRKVEKLKYWRTTAKAEVDFILDDSIPVEVKATPRVTRSLRSFVSRYRPARGFLINYDVLEKKMMGDTELILIPVALL